MSPYSILDSQASPVNANYFLPAFVVLHYSTDTPFSCLHVYNWSLYYTLLLSVSPLPCMATPCPSPLTHGHTVPHSSHAWPHLISSLCFAVPYMSKPCPFARPVVPYAWDEPTFPEKLSLLVKGAREARQFDLRSFGPQGKLYYESYFCLVIKRDEERTGLPQRQSEMVEFALDVPQGKAIILTKKVCVHTCYLCGLKTCV